MSAQPFALLHLFAQPMWHDDAIIAGNRAGLTALRDALDRALATGEGVAAVTVDDGEGYWAICLLAGPDVADDRSNEDEGDLGTPYIDEIAGPSRPSDELERRAGDAVERHLKGSGA